MSEALYPHNTRWKAVNPSTNEVIIGRVRAVTDFTIHLHTGKDVQVHEDTDRDVLLSLKRWHLAPHPSTARPIYAPPAALEWLTPEEVVASCYTGAAGCPKGEALDADLEDLQARIDAGDLCTLNGSGSCRMSGGSVVLMRDVWLRLSDTSRAMLLRFDAGYFDGV